jgi:PleD family two-component response regulator
MLIASRGCSLRADPVKSGFPSSRFTMQKPEAKKVLAVMSDLFFSVKITEAAKRAGMVVDFAKSPDEVVEKAKAKPAMIIFDLNFGGVEPIAMVRKLKSSAELKGISLIGFLSHVQGELKQQAIEAGYDMVLARSAFSQNLPQIFKRHGGTL